MALDKKNREQIKNYILKQIDARNEKYVQRTIENFSISKTTVYNYVKQMVESGIIEKIDGAKFSYQLVNEIFDKSYSTKDNLQEDVIFSRDIKGLLSELPQNVFDIWRYSFTEIMNNAIEHSEASDIYCLLQKNKLNTTIIIGDNGVGIFNKIQRYFRDELNQEITLDEAVAELFAGKLTTAIQNHSGEGIFFTSRAVDNFIILSGSKVFSHSSYQEFTEEFEELVSNDINKCEGTDVFMKLSNSSSKNLGDIMYKYSDVDRGFYRTILPIVNMIENGYPVSRSEARRLGTVICKFEEVTLDFENIENIGQAFVHELFVVFKREHPNIVINVENTNENVSNMIKRVLNSNNSFLRN